MPLKYTLIGSFDPLNVNNNDLKNYKIFPLLLSLISMFIK